MLTNKSNHRSDDRNHYTYAVGRRTLMMSFTCLPLKNISCKMTTANESSL